MCEQNSTNDIIQKMNLINEHTILNYFLEIYGACIIYFLVIKCSIEYQYFTIFKNNQKCYNNATCGVGTENLKKKSIAQLSNVVNRLLD